MAHKESDAEVCSGIGGNNAVLDCSRSGGWNYLKLWDPDKGSDCLIAPWVALSPLVSLVRRQASRVSGDLLKPSCNVRCCFGYRQSSFSGAFYAWGHCYAHIRYGLYYLVERNYGIESGDCHYCWRIGINSSSALHLAARFLGRKTGPLSKVGAWKRKMTFSFHSKVLFYCPFAINSKLLTLQANKKTTPGFPGVVIFLLSGWEPSYYLLSFNNNLTHIVHWYLNIS